MQQQGNFWNVGSKSGKFFECTALIVRLVGIAAVVAYALITGDVSIGSSAILSLALT